MHEQRMERRAHQDGHETTILKEYKEPLKELAESVGPANKGGDNRTTFSFTTGVHIGDKLDEATANDPKKFGRWFAKFVN